MFSGETSLYMTEIHIGVVGCGFIAQAAHLPSFSRLENVRLTAICDARIKLARLLAEKYKIPKVYSSYLDLLEDGDLDAVLVLTGKFSHKSIVVDACKAGKHVFVEKPMATTAEDAKTMVEVADKSGVKLMVGYMKRYDSGVKIARRVLTEMSSSDAVTYVRTHIFGGDWVCGPTIHPIIETDEPKPKEEVVYPEYGERFVQVAEALLEQIHDINLTRYMLGDPEEVSYAQNWVDGNFIAVLNYGTFPAVLEQGWITADFWDEYMEVYMRNGWVRLTLPPPLLRNVPAKVEVYKAGKIQREEKPHGSWRWSFEAEAEHFIDCIRRDQTPVSDGYDSYKDLVIVEAILKSMGERKTVNLRF